MSFADGRPPAAIIAYAADGTATEIPVDAPTASIPAATWFVQVLADEIWWIRTGAAD